MKKLLFGIHNHQPVGNFDWVLKFAYEKSYLPFLEIVRDYPEFKFALHITGPLWEWFEKEAPEIMDILTLLVKRRQVELVVSGFYEPVLAAIPESDRIAQIKKSLNYVKKNFGYNPKGLWLTERVWESEIVHSLVKSGIKYVLVDDFHFIAAGKKKDQLHGYYVTETERETLGVFPIDENLRYLIPFRPVEESIDYIKHIPGEAAIIFDDGEKFGVWPNTYEWVYEKGWLKKFIENVLEDKDIETVHFADYINSTPPLGRIYLPTASYFEMGEWSLPQEAALQFSQLVNDLKERGEFDKYKQFLRGGIWKNFLVKYEESNNMHKKMVYLSKKINEGYGTRKKLKEALYRAQCNDAYWHGVFGGLYLPHLRREIYKNLLIAEREIEEPYVEVEDINCDGEDEILLRSKKLKLSLIPHYGGAVFELSFFPALYNLQDTLTRRFEHYHKGIRVGKREDRGIRSIHELEKTVDEKVARELVYDWYLRYSGFFHVFNKDAKLDDLRYMRYRELGDFVNTPFKYKIEGNSILMWREGGIYDADRKPAKLSKRISLFEDRIELVYNLTVNEVLTHRGCVEFNFKFVEPEFIMNGKTWKKDSSMDISARELQVIDPEAGFSMAIVTEKMAHFYVFPFYTISQSESGLDMVYQGTSIVIARDIVSKNMKYKIRIIFKEDRKDARA